MNKSELRQQVVNLIWEKKNFDLFCSQDIENRARGIRMEVSLSFIDETLEKLVVKGSIQGRKLVEVQRSTGTWYKFEKG